MPPTLSFQWENWQQALNRKRRVEGENQYKQVLYHYEEELSAPYLKRDKSVRGFQYVMFARFRVTLKIKDQEFNEKLKPHKSMSSIHFRHLCV